MTTVPNQYHLLVAADKPGFSRRRFCEKVGYWEYVSAGAFRPREDENALDVDQNDENDDSNQPFMAAPEFDQSHLESIPELYNR